MRGMPQCEQETEPGILELGPNYMHLHTYHIYIVTLDSIYSQDNKTSILLRSIIIIHKEGLYDGKYIFTR